MPSSSADSAHASGALEGRQVGRKNRASNESHASCSQSRVGSLVNWPNRAAQFKGERARSRIFISELFYQKKNQPKRRMMLQFNLLKRQESNEAAISAGKQEEEEDEEENEALARERIKRMMNKMQEMQRNRQDELLLSATIESGAIKDNCRPREQDRHSTLMRIDDDSTTTTTTTTTKETSSHELIKRRFFEKLERRKSIAISTPTQISGIPMRNFTSKLSNLREESEYAYGLCSSSSCEIVVANEQTNKNCYLNNNNQLFVCDSAQISSAASLCLTSSQKSTFDESKDDDDDDIMRKVKNDNALTGDQQEEAVYLTLDWKNVQVNEQQQLDNNKEQLSSSQAQNGPRWPPFEQKQIKPLAAANENNKPPAPQPPDMHSEYKHPVPVGQHQQRQQQVSCGSSERETQVLVGCGRQADLVILPKKSVNNNNQQRTSMRTKTNSFVRPTILMRLQAKDDAQSSDSRSCSAGRSQRAQRHSRRLSRCSRREKSCSESSSSSSLSSSSSSALTSSPSSSSSSSIRSLERDERVPNLLRLEQLSLSEDDLKSLISHSNCCRCSECCSGWKEQQRQRGHNYSPASRVSSHQVNGRHCNAATDDVRCVSPDDEDSAKKDDSSNSSSGNSSATRSLMNSLFNRSTSLNTNTTTSNSRKHLKLAASQKCSSGGAHTATAKSVPNLIDASHSLMMIRTRTQPAAKEQSKADSSSGKFWSLFAGSIGPSHAIANRSLPKPSLFEQRESERKRRATLRRSAGDWPNQNQNQKRLEREKQTSGGRDSSNQQHIYSSPLWQPKTAGYRLHLPVAAAHEPAPQQPAYASLASGGKYHSCNCHTARCTNSNSPKHHNHHHHHHHHHRRHHSHRHHRHHERDHHRSRHAHHANLQPDEIGCTQTSALSWSSEHAEDVQVATAASVWGQLIEINKLDGSQVVELEREPGKSWGFFVARGAINKTKGIFVSRMQENKHSRQTNQLIGLLGVGDRLLAIDEHQIGPDYDILQVNRLISKKNKILLKVKPLKG